MSLERMLRECEEENGVVLDAESNVDEPSALLLCARTASVTVVCRVGEGPAGSHVEVSFWRGDEQVPPGQAMLLGDTYVIGMDA